MKTPPRLAVGAIIVDASSAPAPRVVLVRRAHPPNEGAWSLPGGKVEPGETLEQALLREVDEETGLAVSAGPLIEVVELIAPDHHYVVLDYLCLPTSLDLRAGDDAAEAEWVSALTLPSYNVSSAVLRVVSAAISQAANILRELHE